MAKQCYHMFDVMIVSERWWEHAVSSDWMLFWRTIYHLHLWFLSGQTGATMLQKIRLGIVRNVYQWLHSLYSWLKVSWMAYKDGFRALRVLQLAQQARFTPCVLISYHLLVWNVRYSNKKYSKAQKKKAIYYLAVFNHTNSCLTSFRTKYWHYWYGRYSLMKFYQLQCRKHYRKYPAVIQKSIPKINENSDKFAVVRFQISVYGLEK